MELPTIEELLPHIRTKLEIREVARLTLTNHQLKVLGDQAKIVDFQQAMLKRASRNKKVYKVLKNWLYSNLEIPSYKAQELLGINNGLRTKLIGQGVLVPTSERKSKYGNGSVKYFTYENVMKCYSNSQFKTEYENYQIHHKDNVARADKAVKTKQAKSREKMNAYQVKVERVDLVSIYKMALNEKLDFQHATVQMDSDWLRYSDLDQAPDKDRNRWVDNYIRHCLTNYDEMDSILRNQVGKNELFVSEWRQKVNIEIKRVYPFYQANRYVQKYVK